MFTSEQSRRYSRQFVLKEIGVFGQEKLCKSRVLIIGAGGLGSNAIMHLAAAGVGTIGIADYDDVDLSNLQRQVIHSTLSLGMNKADSAEEFVKRLNPDVKVETIKERLTAKNIEKAIENYDFVLDCTDRFENKFLINDACVINKKPFCHGGVIGFEGQVMTYVPSKPCLRCVLRDIPRDAPTCSDFGVIGAAVGVIGSIQALEAIKYLTGRGELLAGKILKFDGLNNNVRIINFKADEDCPICGENRTIIRLKSEEYEIKGECNGR